MPRVDGSHSHAWRDEERQKAREARDAERQAEDGAPGAASASAGTAPAEPYESEVRPGWGCVNWNKIEDLWQGTSGGTRILQGSSAHMECMATESGISLWMQIFTLDQLLTYLRKQFLVTEETVVKAEEKAVEIPQGQLVAV